MSAKSTDGGFVVWDADLTASNPVELPTLISWVRTERVSAGTWVFVIRRRTWERAASIPELQMFFQVRQRDPDVKSAPLTPTGSVDTRVLRRIRLLSYFTDDQLERFAQFVETEQIPQGAVVVKQGDHGNAMYLILEGELSVRMNVGGMQTELAGLGIGDFFGDFSLFDHGPRSADVVANTSCFLLRISVQAFDRLSREATDLATPFLLAIGKTLTARIRAGNKHHGENVRFANALG